MSKYTFSQYITATAITVAVALGVFYVIGELWLVLTH